MALQSLALRGLPWLIAAGAGLSTVGGLLAQVETTEQLNVAMGGVSRNIAEARQLTAETADALAPLASTTDTLAAMNQRLRGMADDVQAMNGSMERMSAGQEAILTRLGMLNQHMGNVVTELGAVNARNRSLLSANTALAAQTEGQVSATGKLSRLTGEGITYLELMNRRFSFLRQF